MTIVLCNEPLTMPPVEFPVPPSEIAWLVVGAGAVVLIIVFAFRMPSLVGSLLRFLRSGGSRW